VISYVNITGAHVDDGGTYGCIVNSAGTQVINLGRVNVIGAPIVRSMKDRVAVEAQPLMLRCPYGGYPIDEVFWEHSE